MTVAVQQKLNPILLVEDNEDDVFFMKRAMGNAHVSGSVHILTDGREAIRYLAGEGFFADREKFPVPSFIFLDLKLPYLNGLEVLSWIRKESFIPHVPVVILSSSRQPRDIRAANELGANSYLVKPATSAELQETINAINNYWFKLDQFCLNS